MASKKRLLFFILLFFFLPYLNLSTYGNSTYASDQGNTLELSALFDPQEVNLSQFPPIDYDGLNNIWYNQKYEMLIVINDSSFLDAINPLVEWKNEKGVKTVVAYNYSDYIGRDKAEKVRNMIKDFYEKENIRWVLLASDADENLIPIREVYNPDTEEIDGESEYSNWDEESKPTDFYYADLTGTWDDNNNDIFGESLHYSGNVDEISWIPEVYVGRLPANNPTELSVMVNKTLKYESDPLYGDWMNRMLLASGMSSYVPPEDEARLTEYIWQNYVLDEINFTHITKTTSSFTPIIPPIPNQHDNLTHTKFLNEFDSGYSTVIFAGHGDPTRWTDASGTTYYNNNDAQSNGNTDMPSLIYADVCTTAPYDKTDDSIGERLIKQPIAGAIGYIGGLRVTWYFEHDDDLEMLNRGNAKLFWREFFEEDKYQQGMALYDSKISYLNSDYFQQAQVSTEQEWERKNILSYNLLGDPELDIYTDTPIDALNPFNASYYEGQLVSIEIKDNMDHIVPRARVNLQTSDGKNYTVYANKNGVANFRLPPQVNENYTGLITGHNLIPTYYNFTTIKDLDNPIITDVFTYPETPTLLDNIFFSVDGNDNHSGMESVFVLISKNNFSDYLIYQSSNGFTENNHQFNITINKLGSGKYSYLFVARDFSNKTSIHYENSFHFEIPQPFIDIVVIVTIIMIIGLVAVSTIIIIIGMKRSKKLTRDLE